MRCRRLPDMTTPQVPDRLPPGAGTGPAGPVARRGPGQRQAGALQRPCRARPARHPRARAVRRVPRVAAGPGDAHHPRSDLAGARDRAGPTLIPSGQWSGGGTGSPATCSRSRPLSRDRIRCPRCPASRCTTRCPHRQAVAARVPRRARPAVRTRPRAWPGALHPRARCRPARQDAAGS